MDGSVPFIYTPLLPGYLCTVTMMPDKSSQWHKTKNYNLIQMIPSYAVQISHLANRDQYWWWLISLSLFCLWLDCNCKGCPEAGKETSRIVDGSMQAQCGLYMYVHTYHADTHHTHTHTPCTHTRTNEKCQEKNGACILVDGLGGR